MKPPRPHELFRDQPSHERPIRQASARRRIQRFEQIDGKIVRVVYTLVHSNNEAVYRRRAFRIVSEEGE